MFEVGASHKAAGRYGVEINIRVPTILNCSIHRHKGIYRYQSFQHDSA
jgi:hypothetical protein